MIGKSTHVSVIPKEPKEGSQFICLSVILIDSVFKKKKKTVIKFGDIEIQKQKFYQHKVPI